MIRLTVHFSGQVQGVGFRYTAVQIARWHAVSGFVQNLPDGRVLLVVEGQRDQVQSLVDQLSGQMHAFIEHQEQAQTTATGEFGTPGSDGLQIRR